MAAGDISFSRAEQDYLQRVRSVTMCVDPDWVPFERINEQGRHEGIAADLVRLVAQRVGLTIELLPVTSWEESLAASKAGRCQLMSFLNQTPARDQWLLFTEPVFFDQNIIIRLSELDSGEDNLLCFEQVDLDEVAGTCVKNLQMNAQKRNVTLYYEGVSCMLRADRGMISELVENLCQNAIRYNNEGGEVHVRVYYEKGQPMLSVADNGIGIPKDQQERIFERFYRVDKSRSKQTGGTGLGLAIVKHIVELHDAVLHLESEPGKGTTITVAF